jgi:hypothetical protein
MTYLQSQESLSTTAVSYEVKADKETFVVRSTTTRMLVRESTLGTTSLIVLRVESKVTAYK